MLLGAIARLDADSFVAFIKFAIFVSSLRFTISQSVILFAHRNKSHIGDVVEVLREPGTHPLHSSENCLSTPFLTVLTIPAHDGVETVINVFLTTLVPQFCDVLSQRQGEAEERDKLVNDFCAGVLTIVAQSGRRNTTALEKLLLTRLLTEQRREAGFCFAQLLLSLHARETPEFQQHFVALLAQILSKTLMHPDALLTVFSSPLAALFRATLLASPSTVLQRVWTTLVTLPAGEAGIATWVPTPLTALLVDTLGMSQAPTPKTPSFQSALVSRLLNLTSESFSVCSVPHLPILTAT